MTDTITLLREAIEYAPPAGRTAPGLRGVWLDNSTVFVCAPCCGRIIGRGCGHLLRGWQAWDEDPVGACVTCPTP